MTGKTQLPERRGQRGGRRTLRERVAIRTCSTACPYREHGGPGCASFQAGQAVDAGPCIPDLETIEDWRRAYEDGKSGAIRRDAGRLMGTMYVHAQRMVEQIDSEGMTFRAPKVDARGNPVLVEREDGVVDYVWEERAHPLLEPLARVVRILGLDPDEYGLTAKSEQHAAALRGNLTLNKTDINVVLEAERERTKEIRKTLELAARLREADPVFREFARTGGGNAP